MNKKILGIGIGVLVLVVVAFISMNKGPTGNVIENSDGTITIPLSEISEKAKFYEYDGIRYFVIRADNNDIKTAFDACDVCYYSDKGYRQEGNYMICNNCGNKYPISGLGTENIRGGGCWPGYHASSIDGENLIIKISDLEKGRYRF